MPESKALSMLGLARRAGKLSMGHDMALQSVAKKKAKMIVFTSDSSKRLVKEFEVFTKKHNPDIPVYIIKPTIDEIHFSLGYRAGVMTVDDDNFCKRIISLLTQEEMIYGN
ncbi:MAG: ribosomal L7Ae/L30e/S12e/Gadd45 family protein [Eubacterium sp.]|nr:ribosomal L7Ae/L30e/S12e/Gadd45 family protein [Eubacterium sp.]